jgi:hypothetical protein
MCSSKRDPSVCAAVTNMWYNPPVPARNCGAFSGSSHLIDDSYSLFEVVRRRQAEIDELRLRKAIAWAQSCELQWPLERPCSNGGARPGSAAHQSRPPSTGEGGTGARGGRRRRGVPHLAQLPADMFLSPLHALHAPAVLQTEDDFVELQHVAGNAQRHPFLPEVPRLLYLSSATPMCTSATSDATPPLALVPPVLAPVQAMRARAVAPADVPPLLLHTSLQAPCRALPDGCTPAGDLSRVSHVPTIRRLAALSTAHDNMAPPSLHIAPLRTDLYGTAPPGPADSPSSLGAQHSKTNTTTLAASLQRVQTLPSPNCAWPVSSSCSQDGRGCNQAGMSDNLGAVDMSDSPDRVHTSSHIEATSLPAAAVSLLQVSGRCVEVPVESGVTQGGVRNSGRAAKVAPVCSAAGEEAGRDAACQNDAQPWPEEYVPEGGSTRKQRAADVYPMLWQPTHSYLFHAPSMAREMLPKGLYKALIARQRAADPDAGAHVRSAFSARRHSPCVSSCACQLG